MAWDIILPNGYTVKGIPESTTPEQVQEMAIKAGFASQADFQPTLHQAIQKDAELPQDADAAASGFAPGKSGIGAWASIPGNVEQAATAMTNQYRTPTHEELTQRADTAKLALMAAGVTATPMAAGLMALPEVGAINTLAGAVTNENETKAQAVKDFAEGAIGEGAGKVMIKAGELVAPIVKPLLERFTPRTAVTAKAHEPVIEDILEKAGTEEAPPKPLREPAPGETPPTQEELIDARKSQETEHDRAFALAAGSHQAAIEMRSYLGKPMWKKASGAAGQDPAKALQYYRQRTGTYFNPDLPTVEELAGKEGMGHLKDLGQMEAVARSDNPYLDAAIKELDEKGEANADQLIEMLNGHQNNTAADIVAMLENAPSPYLEDLLAASKQLNLKGIIDHRAAFNPDEVEAVTAQTRGELEEDLRDAYRNSGLIDNQIKAIDEDIADQTQARKIAGQQGDVAMQNAIEHHIKFTKDLKKNLEEFKETGELPPLTDQQKAQMAMFTAQGKTHIGASGANKIWNDYRRVESTFNALPEVRDMNKKEHVAQAGIELLETWLGKETGKVGRQLIKTGKKIAKKRTLTAAARAAVRKAKR